MLSTTPKRLLAVLLLLFAFPAKSISRGPTLFERYALTLSQACNQDFFFCLKNVNAAWDASRFVPSWGPRAQATRRLLAAECGESSMNPLAVNRNGGRSTDLGLYQVNSVHWKDWREGSLWHRFCRINGLQLNDFHVLLVPHYAAQFAAILEQNFNIHHLKGYRFKNSPWKRSIYRGLLFDRQLDIMVALDK
jgi:hypothetical protein